MKKVVHFLVTLSFILSTFALHAGEGMWLPLLLKALNEEEMQSMGMKMSAEDIYSVNQGSLKDAIVHFGGFCTSEIISSEGLLLTNHHCGYRQIQSHTTLDNNYLEDGFWAMDKSQELQNPGLTATLIVRIEDVTEAVMAGVSDGMSSADRQSLIDLNINAALADVKKEAHEDAAIKPFFKGNQYFLFVTVTYRDVRLVGAPPSSIGKFGADTDNWVWPRHTGDFSLFRIYAGPDNLPADYSEDNVPYKPKHFLPISLDGVEQGDFTLVFGFPGRTNQYLPSPAVKQVMQIVDPARIAVRDEALKIIDSKMRQDPEIKIQYASKFASIANGWKKWIGEVQGLTKTDALGRKAKFEAEFTKKVNANPKWKSQYGSILSDFQRYYDKINPLTEAKTYFDEVVGRNVEITRIANAMNRLVTTYENGKEEGYIDMRNRLKPALAGFYKNYRAEVDREVFPVLMAMYFENVDPKYFTDDVKSMIKNVNGDYEKLAETIFNSSFLASADQVKDFWELEPAEAIEKLNTDPAMKLATMLREAHNQNVLRAHNEVNEEIQQLQRTYMKALMEVFSDRTFYPDANSTLRVTYGQVAGYTPRDAVTYTPVTYLEGVMEKYKPGDYEFDVPEKLRQLYEDKDYGEYAEDGKIPVCFIGSNHTSGGNSGSPAIDAEGNLIGLNFDRVWEGTMSDINYDASICRNIMVDIRYVLFIVDKFAGAGHLVEEMTLVHPKKG